MDKNTVSTDTILAALEGWKISLRPEKRMQADIEKVLNTAGISYQRECRLSAKDIPDFFCDGVVIEVKVSKNSRATYCQLERYAQHDEVREIILITSRTMPMPNFIYGKPVTTYSAGLAWL